MEREKAIYFLKNNIKVEEIYAVTEREDYIRIAAKKFGEVIIYEFRPDGRILLK